MRTNTHTPGTRPGVLLILAALVLAPLITLAAPATPAAADPTAITAAPPLTWGYKASWRNYAGMPTVSDGASIVDVGGQYDIGWTFVDGSFDPSTKTTVLEYSGTVHWAKYPLRDFPSFIPPGYTGSLDVNVLDITLSDPVVTISRDRADIVVDAIARPRQTMELTEHPDSAVVKLDVSTVVPTVAGGTTTWPAITAAAGPGSFDAFGGMYPEGLAIDSVAFSYTGPGGAPDFSDLFDAPGTVKLELARNEILTTNGSNEQLALWWYDQANQVTHWRTTNNVAGTTTYYAFDLETMSRVGQPWVVNTSDAIRPSQLLFSDPETGRALYWSVGLTTRSITFDPVAGYQTAAITPDFPRGNTFAFNWDPVGHRAVNLMKTIPDGVGAQDYDNHVWKVLTYTETTPGTWVREEHVLNSFPLGLNQKGYQGTTATPFAATMAALPDGSLVVLGTSQSSNNPNVPNPTTFAGAHRIVLHGDGTATSQPIAGTQLTASGSLAYERIMAGPDGQMSLISNGDGVSILPRVQTLRWNGEAGTVTAGAPLPMPGLFILNLQHSAIDPQDGTVWLNDYTGRRMVGVKDGRVVTSQLIAERHPRGGWIFVGDDSTVYAQTNDGSNLVPTYGIGELTRLGSSPTVTGSPEDAAVTLGVGETSEEVTFASSATGVPEPDRQWQVKAPGSARFVDVPDATGATLTVTAAPGMDGSEYRALFSNAAGRIATEPATLAVEHAPIISFQPPDLSVLAGTDAAFDLEVTATPEADVTWQRYAGGFWWNIGPDDDGFVVTDTSLTVTGTNVDQDGTRLRARVRNTVGTVHSRVATLSVTEPADDPQYVVGGDLDWGVRQSFRTYITGPIAHGAIETSAGATVDTDDTFLFPAAGGTVDGDVVDADFDGTVRFTGHDGTGTPPGVPALDVRISDIRIDADGQDGTLVADVVSRGLEDGDLTTYDDIAVADLDLSGITPTPVEGGLRWSAVPATLTEQGVPAFADFYEAGSDLDPLTVTLALADEEPEPERTPTESFATAALTDLLGEEPTGEQVASAVTAIEATGKTTFLRSLTTSDQWLAAIVDDLYADTLGRPASDADRAFWTGRLRAGWTVARVAASFYAAPEYYDGIGGGTDATWVADLYAKLLDRTGATDEIDYWVDETVAKGRGNVALRFYQTPESARTRVTGLYDHLLGRAPSEGDLAFWAAQVVRRGDLTLAVSLALSPEYQARAETRFP